eukprot:scaffold596_cov236-Pinguiococcus_pyrenoidosus.AAC.8
MERGKEKTHRLEAFGDGKSARNLALGSKSCGTKPLSTLADLRRLLLARRRFTPRGERHDDLTDVSAGVILILSAHAHGV